MTVRARAVASAAATIALVPGCAAASQRGDSPPAAGPFTSAAASAAASPAPSVSACDRRSLIATFAGGGLGTGNDFGTIVVGNIGDAPCRIAGSISFAAYFEGGRRDVDAGVARPLGPVDLVLPPSMPRYRDGADPRGYLTADLMGPERDDPARPDGLCRQQDKLAPVVLVLTLGSLTFRVPNLDPKSLQAKQVYGCHGRVLLEQVQRAP